ncbi:GNAT family N-acetyltransferase [Metabacillus iocasae]|uniref:Ribosomal protein S18 acetylase RimI-like enzyme n=1 Tax=Priestia iocasae TaxID=2291674 RepID=A0ABS2QXD1_9BACI|nr:GNAT family N-acetyltransferase [Metabacillus iocasae]MBM7703913.1 ribosomal protein S18 acetylase RimI-like enzyme [Metabacillus iocasae]
MERSYDIETAIPTPAEYVELRRKAGMSPKEVETARVGLKNSLFAVTLRDSSKLIGMGRVIGDGACFFHVVDIAVDPSYQGRGLGKVIMSQITAYLDAHAPKSAYVSLMADVPADQLYKQFGFHYTYPKSLGMYKRY